APPRPTALTAARARDGAHAVRVEPGEVRLLAASDADLAALISGTVRGGRVTLGARRIDRLGTAARVRRGLGVVTDAAVADDVTVVDHLAAIAGRRAATAALASAPLLRGRGSDAAGVLSGGERRVLAWLRCIVARPNAVVLDAAGTGMDAATLDWAGRVVAAWAQAGVAVVIRPGRDEERRWALPGPPSPS
ncbi:MAG TPA: hypothetical protein VGV67_07410, partial [Solirubrobacteraceae bacterium]|nr:hypothetical protein [Solirubrobacteraceae bacterium]